MYFTLSFCYILHEHTCIILLITCSAELQEAFKQRNVPDLLLSIQKHIWILARSVGLKALDCWLLEEECSTQSFLISSWDYWKELLCDFQNVILKICMCVPLDCYQFIDVILIKLYTFFKGNIFALLSRNISPQIYIQCSYIYLLQHVHIIITVNMKVRSRIIPPGITKQYTNSIK
jgi:hypothetical protein